MSGPVTITQGGTYSGDWTSTTSTPTVRVTTSEPVTITNSSVTNQRDGPLIDVPDGVQANLTITRVTGHGGSGRFVDAEGFASIVIRNCTLYNTGGISLKSPVAGATISVTRNRAKNIQKATGLRQFLQLNNVQSASSEVSWNQVVNVYRKSEVEDNISLYKSSNVTVHDNYIQGAYPRYHRDSYSGSGIVVGDDGGSFNRVYQNQIVDTTNVGIGIVGGHDNEVRNNRVVSDGRLNDGTPLASANVGIVVWNPSDDPTWANNRARGNRIAWVNAVSNRNDMWFPHALNTRMQTRVSRTTELQEYRRWLAKLAANGIRIGA